MVQKFRYSYHLPKELIAQQPASPRDSARLFVYDTHQNEIVFDRFFNLSKYIPRGSLLVFNDTMVIPVRVNLRKETGGRAEVLFLVNEWRRSKPIRALVDRKVNVGAKLFLDGERYFTIMRQKENIFYLMPSFRPEKIFALLDKKGKIPIPKYIRDSGLGEFELRRRYQSVFAATPLSIAAPTASLHFTKRLLRKLEKNVIHKTFITLHVGRGTFAPLLRENISTGTLHEELLDIPSVSVGAIRMYKNTALPVVAVGTTVMRALESESSEILSNRTPASINTATRIFIRPPYNFRIADAFITNFHLPDTSLMMLAQAFLAHKGAGRNLLDLYEIAIKEKFRFYSFGDAMLIR